MKKATIAILIIMFALNSFSQLKAVEKLNSFSVAIPTIWNNSEATFYRLGSPVYPVGKAISYGITVSYSRRLTKICYAIGGFGYFKQAFGIMRPFIYNSTNSFGYSTKWYKYDNVHFFLGVGFELPVAKTFSLKSEITYNQYFSFRQKYISTSPVNNQINNKFIATGKMLNLNIGLSKEVTHNISLGLGVIFPLITRWEKDKIFFKYDYSDDTQQIARNKFSIGTNITVTHNF